MNFSCIFNLVETLKQFEPLYIEEVLPELLLQVCWNGINFKRTQSDIRYYCFLKITSSQLFLTFSVIPLPNDKSLALSKLEAFANDK